MAKEQNDSNKAAATRAQLRLAERMAAEVGRAPCDKTCPHRSHCAATGDACAAFYEYVNSGDRSKLVRDPSPQWGYWCNAELTPNEANEATREMNRLQRKQAEAA